MEPAHLLATSPPVLQGRSAATSTSGPHPPAKPHPRGILAAHHTQPVGDTDRDGDKPQPQRGSAKLPSGSLSLESLPHLAPSATKAGK